MEEQKLLELLRKKPEKGIREAMAAYMGLCYAIVRGRLAGFPQEDIEECVSDVFLEAYRSRGKIDLEKGGLRAFVTIVARRRAIDRYASAKRAETQPLDGTLADKRESLAFEDKDALRDALRTLPEEDRKILLWKYCYGLATKEIAEILEMKGNTVDQRARRSLQRLRTILEGEIS